LLRKYEKPHLIGQVSDWLTNKLVQFVFVNFINQSKYKTYRNHDKQNTK